MPSGDPTRAHSPFTISGTTIDNFVVHFQKRAHSLSLEIYAALERPTLHQKSQPFHTETNAGATGHKTLQVRYQLTILSPEIQVEG